MDYFTPHLLNTLCTNVAWQLNRLPNELERAEGPTRTWARLIFPTTAAHEVRVSEQEARILFTQELERWGISYAVETPTSQSYQFTGEKGERSASTDVTLFERSPDGGFRRKVLVELKAHNVQQKNITKDVEKLLREKECGLFFHILKATDSGTLTADQYKKGVLAKYRLAFTELLDKLEPEKDRSWFLHIVVLSMNPGFLLSKSVTGQDLAAIEGFFDFQYRIIRGALTVRDNNGWTVLDLQNARHCSCGRRRQDGSIIL